MRKGVKVNSKVTRMRKGVKVNSGIGEKKATFYINLLGAFSKPVPYLPHQLHIMSFQYL